MTRRGLRATGVDGVTRRGLRATGVDGVTKRGLRATGVVPEPGASLTSAVGQGKTVDGNLLSSGSMVHNCWSWFVIVTLLGLRCLGGLMIWERWVSGPEDARSFGVYPRWAITVDDSKRRPKCSLLLGLVTSGLRQ